MVKMAKIDWPNVEARYARDGSIRGYAYRKRWRAADGAMKTMRIALPGDPTSAEFASRYAELHAEPAPSPAAAPYSFRALISSYKMSPRFAKLAVRTRKDYEAILVYFDDRIGHLDAARWRRRDVVAMRDALSATPRKANYRVQLLSILMRHAVELEWRADNPAKGVELFALEGEYLPWPDWAIDGTLAANADPGVDLAMRIALAIGPRPDDLLSLRWSDFDGEGIGYTQSKTRVAVWAPLLPDMRDRLAAAKRSAKGLYIVAQHNGKPFKYRWFMRKLDAARKAAGAEAYSPHGWRKNATVTLADAGCTDDEIKAITGHTTSSMVRHYAKGSRRKALARRAMDRVEKTGRNKG